MLIFRYRPQPHREELQASVGELPPPRPQARPHDSSGGAPNPRTSFQMGKQVSYIGYLHTLITNTKLITNQHVAQLTYLFL